MFYRAYVPRDSPAIAYEIWYLFKETPKGCWIVPKWSLTFGVEDPYDKKWVPEYTRFVSRTKEEALDNLWARKRAHVRHARRRFKEAARAFRIVRMNIDESPVLRGKLSAERRLVEALNKTYGVLK